MFLAVCVPTHKHHCASIILYLYIMWVPREYFSRINHPGVVLGLNFRTVEYLYLFITELYIKQNVVPIFVILLFYITFICS